MVVFRYKKYKTIAILCCAVIVVGPGCKKASSAPDVSGVAALTVVNAVNASSQVTPVIGTGTAISWFSSAVKIGYGGFYEYSPIAGLDTIYVVQSSDTLNVSPKSPDFLYYNIANLKRGGIYSLFLCGADTSSPDNVFTIDTLPNYQSPDSVLGIRFVNLVAGSAPLSVNLEGGANGSEVSSLAYKGLTPFKGYLCNSTVPDYLFVVRDGATGDSLTQFDFNMVGSVNLGYGLIDPYSGGLLTFRNISIVIYGTSNGDFPMTTALIDNY